MRQLSRWQLLGHRGPGTATVTAAAARAAIITTLAAHVASTALLSAGTAGAPFSAAPAALATAAALTINPRVNITHSRQKSRRGAIVPLRCLRFAVMS